ncbi:hypothetical protein PUNSTDRAFT_119267, partial [Punctularia strigosozonata HHB-11173 SS5]|uniref:uncharacterized protein n=1 Tax=Punctularia strigosozonata (strain HHB-11173) TaxID=741275 RepID=UPI0004417E56
MKFLCVPGADFRSRIEETKRCRCDLSLPLENRMHRVSVDVSTELWDFIATMVASAMKIYISTPPSLRSQFHSDSHPPWPSATSDFVPYGLQATLDSLVELVHNCVPSSFHILHNIGVVFGRCTVMKMLVN